jgi:hypothetical protein
MPYSLQATATGLNKSTVLRAIKAGKVSAVRDEQGQWQVVLKQAQVGSAL